MSFIACIATSGAIDLSGGFRDDTKPGLATTCSSLAKRGAETAETDIVFSLPSPLSDEVLIGGHSVEMGIEVDPYGGPGSYDLTQQILVENVNIDGININGPTTYTLPADPTTPGSTGTVIVSADGSGSMTLSNLVGLNANGPAGSLSVTMTWVCVPNYY